VTLLHEEAKSFANKILYHGTITPFDTIDTNMGLPYKDFGRGFYVGEDYIQALGLAENRKAGKLKMFKDLKAEKLGIQYFFKNAIAVSSLTKIHAEVIK